MNDETKDIQDMSDAERKTIAEAGPGTGSMLFDRQAFAQAYQIARLFSQSQLVPQHLQGKPNDCFIALHMADRLGEDPLMICQNIVIIHGTAGWKAQWLIGRANRSGVFKGRIKFDTSGSGDDLEVTARATMADTGEEVTASASMKMAKAEGWTSNKKYQSMPQQMLSYRAASFLIRLYCPEATLGYQSAEEVEDMAASGQIRDVSPGRHTPTDEPQNGGAEQALRNLGQDMSGSGESPDGGGAPAGQPDEDPAVDRHGTPWDERIHAQTKTTNKDGSWKRKRGISDEYFERILAGIMNTPADDTPTGAAADASRGASDDPPDGSGSEASDETVAPEQGGALPDDFDTGAVPGESAGPDWVQGAIERMENAESRDEVDEIADEVLNGTDASERDRERLTAAHKRNVERLEVAS